CQTPWGPLPGSGTRAPTCRRSEAPPRSTAWSSPTPTSCSPPRSPADRDRTIRKCQTRLGSLLSRGRGGIVMVNDQKGAVDVAVAWDMFECRVAALMSTIPEGGEFTLYAPSEDG